MKLGILKTGRPPSTCIPEFGTYPDMFIRLLGPDAYDYSVYAADEGELPASPTACDAYLVTGPPRASTTPCPGSGSSRAS